MAKHTTIAVLDDIDGSPDAEEVVFGYEGMVRSVDLSPDNRKRFHEAVAEFVERSEPVRDADGRPLLLTRRGVARSSSTSAATKLAAERRLVRAWWRDQDGDAGLPPFSAYGRLPQAVLDAYARRG